MNHCPKEVLEATIVDLSLRLQACEEQSRFRKAALESILYATRMPVCQVCFESLENERPIRLLRTNCNNIICGNCWRKCVLADRARFGSGLPASICMFRTCLKRNDKGDILLDDNQKMTIGPCGITCETKNDKLLYRIALTRQKLEDRFEAAIIPNVFSDVKPFLLGEMDFPDKRFTD